MGPMKPLRLKFDIAMLGYKQELRRNFTMFEVFGMWPQLFLIVDFYSPRARHRLFNHGPSSLDRIYARIFVTCWANRPRLGKSNTTD